MADQQASLQEILARLGTYLLRRTNACYMPFAIRVAKLTNLGFKGAAQSATPQPPPGAGAGLPAYPPPQQYPNAPPPAPYGAPNPYSYPQPSASGSVDLSKVTPYSSGVVPGPGAGGDSFQDAIAKARSYASNHGATPYERPANSYGNDHRGGASSGYPRSRSRSPRRDQGYGRDNYNSYRDERREDRGRDQGFGRDRERSFSPRSRRQNNTFSPRGGHGARERSPMGGGGDDNSEIMQIEASLVGLIIGRGGENLRRIENDTQCRVQFLPAAPTDGDHRQCKISGPAFRRAEARAAINRIIDDSGMAPLNRGGGGGGGGGYNAGGRDRNAVIEPKEGEECIQIMVPDRTVGLIIGRGGETIRDLQERSGCHINIVGEQKSVNGLRPVNLIGSMETTTRAKNLIMEIVDSDTRNGGAPGGGGGGRPQYGDGPPGRGQRGDHMGGGPDKTNDSIYVPSEAVGMIIGKGGETIREMQSSTGCKINVSQSSGPNETEREIGLVGSLDAIARAKQAIEDKVEAVRQKNSGGGGGGGSGYGGRGRHRDYDNPNYGQASNHSAPAAQSQQPPAVQGQPAGGAAGADPYAACKHFISPSLRAVLFLFIQTVVSNILSFFSQMVATKRMLPCGSRPWPKRNSNRAVMLTRKPAPLEFRCSFEMHFDMTTATVCLMP